MRVGRVFQGENARMSSFIGAIAIADLVKSTLGPKGMDKILQSASGAGGISVTNDGATILGSIVVDNPAAKVLINISKTQDDEVGDGTTRCDILWCSFERACVYCRWLGLRLRFCACAAVLVAFGPPARFDSSFVHLNDHSYFCFSCGCALSSLCMVWSDLAAAVLPCWLASCFVRQRN